MNGKLMDTAHQNSGVPPCLNGSLETGIYFFNEGGHIKIGKLCRDYTTWNSVFITDMRFFSLFLTMFFNYSYSSSDNSFVIGLEFKIIFNVRLRSLTGVLLHSGSKQDSYLAVYMEAGKVSMDLLSFQLLWHHAEEH